MFLWHDNPMSLQEIKTAVLQLPLAEQSELVSLLLKSIEQSQEVPFPVMSSLGIVESDFDAATSEQALFEAWNKHP
jgi:hypothetical protein